MGKRSERAEPRTVTTAHVRDLLATTMTGVVRGDITARQANKVVAVVGKLLKRRIKRQL